MQQTDLQSALIAARAKNLGVGTLGMLSILGSKTNEVDGSATLSYLHKKLAVSSSAATGLADRLEKLGYAVRRHDRNDRRVIYIDITPAGKTALAEILARQPEPAAA